MTMTEIEKTERRFNKLPEEIREYLEFFPVLIDICKNSRKKRSWDSLVLYLLSRVERAHVWSIYCGAVKKHGVNPQLAKDAIAKRPMRQEDFPVLYKSIFGIPLSDELKQKTDYAYYIADRIFRDGGDCLTKREKSKAVRSTVGILPII